MKTSIFHNIKTVYICIHIYIKATPISYYHRKTIENLVREGKYSFYDLSHYR